jgi:ferric-dicitrate binding protein FerR (iron transport regulator)
VAAPVVLAANNTVLTDTLPDQSVITLNKHAELKYHETSGDGGVRRATLKGEGFFKIKPDKSKPFVVLVDGIEVTVVGTSFNIRNAVDSTVIIVESGIVNVKKNGETLELKKGESLTVPHIGSLPVKRTTPDRLYNYYRSREFVCDNTPLWKLVEVLNQAYETNIILENRSVRNSPYTVTFHNEPIDKIAAIIAETFELSLTKTGDTITLK